MARAIRATGGTVCWVQHTVDDRSRAEWSNWLAMGVAERQSALEDLKVGSGGHALIPALETEPGDEFVRKYRYSAFIQGSSDLPELLRAKGCDTVAVVGALTNVCCESSARDAMMLNFKTIMVSDANASHTQEEHLASLASFYASFGDVMSTDELIGYLRRPGVRRDAVETAETPRRFGQAPATSAT